MQGDFTDQPEHIPELVRRFEGGADLVIAERGLQENMPVPERRLRTMIHWLRRPFFTFSGTSDPFGTYRLIRLSVVRDLLKARGDAPLFRTDGWCANVELFHEVLGIARRVESVPLAPRYDLRPRGSRRRPMADAWGLCRTVPSIRRKAPAPPAAPRPASA
jgi:hypothetical protein